MHETAVLRVLEQKRNRLGRVLLVRPDDPGRTALDPAGAVGARLADDAAAHVVNRAAALVERDVGEADAAVADAAKDEPAFERLVLVGRNRDEPAVTFRQAVAGQLDR